MPLDGIVRIRDLNIKASQFQGAGDYEVARVHYMAALLLDPNNSVVLGNLAGLLYRMQKHEAGVAVGSRAVRVNPDDHLARNNLAINLIAIGRISEAGEHLAAIAKLVPDDIPGWHTRGSMLYCQERFGEAAAAFQQARDLGYDEYVTQNDQSLAMMAEGRLSEALPLYEVRWEQLSKNAVWELEIPEWKGESLGGKSIIASAEQGFGDSIMLCRFIPKLIALGATVQIAVPKVLVRLMTENFPDIPVFDCFAPSGEFVKTDFHVPMLSMIRYLGVTPETIDPSPYLSAKEPLTKPLPGLYKIGICWVSGDHGPELARRRRIVPFELLLPLTSIPGVQVVSLQKDENRQAIYDLGAEALIIDPMSRTEDFYDTARLIHQLDLVISVDSAVAHLAGAIGKPTIIFGPRPRCWRWWNQPSGLPWYENMKIYQQDEKLSWESAVRQAISDVETNVRNLLKGVN